MDDVVQDTKVLEAQAKAQDLERAALEKQIEQMELKITALSDTATRKRQEAQNAFRAKHAKRFTDVDPGKALSGLQVVHTVTIFDVAYALRVPNGEHQRAAQMFAMDPMVKENDKTIDVGPVTKDERTLICWLTSVSMKGQAKDLAAATPAVRLKLLRTLPPVLLSQLAAECELLETFLSVVLELELGNFSPTP